MLCNHVVCASCTKHNGLCQKCIEKIVVQVQLKATAKQEVRRSRYLRKEDLHLTREPEDGKESVVENEEQQESVAKDTDSESDADANSGDDNETILDVTKKDIIENLKATFRRNIMALSPLRSAATNPPVVEPETENYC